MSIRVSVVIPVYNTGPYLRECLESAVGQTLSRSQYEIIAVDDGSTDESPQILAEFAARYEQVRTHRIDRSGSAARPRNTGIDLASGDYVFFLDADDKIAPQTLKRLLAVAEETGSDMVLCRMENMPGGTRMVPRSVFTVERRSEDFVESFAYRTLGPTKLYRLAHVREHGLRFMEGYSNGEDLPFTMASFLLANHISAISDRPYYFVRTRTEGTNTSRLGQPPADNLTKNLNVIGVVERLTEPGDRRSELLARSFTFGPGLTRSFQQEYLLLGEDERRELVERAVDGAAHLWNESLRERSDPWKRAMLEAVFARDHAEVDHLAANRGEPMVTLDRSGTGFVHTSVSGRVSRADAPKLVTSIGFFEVTGSTLLTQVPWKVPAMTQAPDRVALVWRHRETPTERVDEPDELTAGVAAFRTSLRDLSLSGTWDAFLEVAWGELLVRRRLGHRSQEGGEPIGVGHPMLGVVFFTEHSNLSYDSGGTRRLSPIDRPLRLAKIVPRGLRTVLLVEDSLAGSSDEEVVISVRAAGRSITFTRTARRIGRTMLMAQYPLPLRRKLAIEIVRGEKHRTVSVPRNAAWRHR